MVNVTKGVMVECDPAMKQFLLYLDETLKLGSRFIIQDLDETHLFISSDVLGRRHVGSSLGFIQGPNSKRGLSLSSGVQSGLKPVCLSESRGGSKIQLAKSTLRGVS